MLLLRDPAVQITGETGMPGVETAIVVLFLTQMVLMIVVGVAAVLPRSANRSHRVGLAGAGSALMCGFALVLGAMFSAGVVLRFGDYLGESTTVLAAPTVPDSVPIVVPNALTWAALGAAFMFVLVVVAALVTAVVVLAVGAVRSLPKLTRFLRGFVERVPAPDLAAAERDARARQVAARRAPGEAHGSHRPDPDRSRARRRDCRVRNVDHCRVDRHEPLRPGLRGTTPCVDRSARGELRQLDHHGFRARHVAGRAAGPQ